MFLIRKLFTFSLEQTAGENHSFHFEKPQHLQGRRSIRNRGLNQSEMLSGARNRPKIYSHHSRTTGSQLVAMWTLYAFFTS